MAHLNGGPSGVTPLQGTRPCPLGNVSAPLLHTRDRYDHPYQAARDRLDRTPREAAEPTALRVGGPRTGEADRAVSAVPLLPEASPFGALVIGQRRARASDSGHLLYRVSRLPPSMSAFDFGVRVLLGMLASWRKPEPPTLPNASPQPNPKSMSSRTSAQY